MINDDYEKEEEEDIDSGGRCDDVSDQVVYGNDRTDGE